MEQSTPSHAPPSTQVRPQFTVHVDDPDDGRAVLSATGDLDLASLADLQALITAREAAGRLHLCLDLGGVTFLDCSCLRVLVDAQLRLRARGGTLEVTQPSGAVMRLLKVTRTDHLLMRGGTR